VQGRPEQTQPVQDHPEQTQPAQGQPEHGRPQSEQEQAKEVSFGTAFENAANALISHTQTGLGLQEVGASSERAKSFEKESGGKDAGNAAEGSSGSAVGR
jgi:hypothetical protein